MFWVSTSPLSATSNQIHRLTQDVLWQLIFSTSFIIAECQVSIRNNYSCTIYDSLCKIQICLCCSMEGVPYFFLATIMRSSVPEFIPHSLQLFPGYWLTVLPSLGLADLFGVLFLFSLRRTGAPHGVGDRQAVPSLLLVVWDTHPSAQVEDWIRRGERREGTKVSLSSVFGFSPLGRVQAAESGVGISSCIPDSDGSTTSCCERPV